MEQLGPPKELKEQLEKICVESNEKGEKKLTKVGVLIVIFASISILSYLAKPKTK